jgi:hypothetical protein
MTAFELPTVTVKVFVLGMLGLAPTVQMIEVEVLDTKVQGI